MSTLYKINEKTKGKDYFFTIKELLIDTYIKNKNSNVTYEIIKNDKKEYLEYKKYMEDFFLAIKKNNSIEKFCKFFIYTNSFLKNIEDLNIENFKIKIIKESNLIKFQNNNIIVYPNKEYTVMSNKIIQYDKYNNLLYNTEDNTSIIKYNRKTQEINFQIINEDYMVCRLFNSYLNDKNNLKLKELIDKFLPIFIFNNKINNSSINFDKMNNKMITSKRLFELLEMNELLNDNGLVNTLNKVLNKNNEKIKFKV